MKQWTLLITILNKTNAKWSQIQDVLIISIEGIILRLFYWCEKGGPVDPIVFIEKSKVDIIFSFTYSDML